MSNYMTKAAAHARLLKLASAARVIRRQRALQKYAQAVQMQKAALDIDLSGHKVGVGTGIGALGGGLLGAGLGYGFGKKDKKLLSTLLGAGIGTVGGAGLGALGGYALSRGGKTEPLSAAPAEFIDGVGKRVDKIPEGVFMTALNDPENFGLEGDNWKISAGGDGRYISNGTVTYYAPQEALERAADARRVMMGEEAFFGKNLPGGKYNNTKAYWR